MTTIVIVRHGHTAWNSNDRFRGLVDVPLDEQGLKEAGLVADAVASRFKAEAIYSSAVDRAMVTAKTIASRFGLPVTVEPGLLDADYGKWTGLSFEEAKARDPELYDICLNRASQFRAPGGDSMEEIRERAVAAVKRLAAEHEGKTIVLVTHTLVIRLILLGILGLSTDNFWRIRQDTCAINILEYDKGIYYLGAVNDSCHIREGMKAST